MEKNENPMSPDQYRARLLNKLNCLVAVLEVAIAKIGRSLASSSGSSDRLEKIRENLENTLAICRRARTTLEKSDGPAGEGPRLGLEKPAAPRGKRRRPGRGSKSSDPKQVPRRPMTYRDYVELSSVKEYRKFKQLPPISPKELDGLDLDQLIRKLQAG